MKRACLCTQKSGSNLIEEIWCGQKNTRHIQVKKSMRFKSKTKQSKKLSIIHSYRKMGCPQERTRNKSKDTYKTENITLIKLSKLSAFSSLYWNVAKIYGYASFSCRKCFLSFRLKVKMVEDLIQSGTEDYNFRPTNVREKFPEEE